MATIARHRANLLAVLFAIGVMPATLCAGPKDGEMPAEPEPGAYSHLNPPELQFSDFGTFNKAEDWFAERLAKGESSERLAAARALWRGRSRIHAADVIKFLAGPPPGGAEYRALQRQVEAAMQPESILRELKDGDYLWGTWLAFLRPHKDLVHPLLVGLKGKKNFLAETILALGNSGDPRALEPLLELLKSEEYRTPGDAAVALGYLGDVKAEPPLIEALDRDKSWVQFNAAKALGMVGTAKALPALMKVIDRGSAGTLNTTGIAMKAVVHIERRHLPRDPARWPASPESKPVTSLHGHSALVWAVSFSPDGKSLASGGDDGTVRIWDSVKGEATAAFRGHADQMIHIAFTNSTAVATAGHGDDRSVRVLDVRTGKTLIRLKETDHGVSSMAVSPDGKLIAMTDFAEEEAVQVWNVETGKVVATLSGVSSVLAFSPDGKVLATTHTGSTAISFWQWAAGKLIGSVGEKSKSASVAAFSPDGRLLASGSDWTLRIWDLKTGKQTVSCRGDSDIQSISFNSDGRSIATGEYDGPVRVWDVATGKAIAVLKARGPVAFSPDGKRLATQSEARSEILLWDSPGRERPMK